MIPSFDERGYLPPGIHRASLHEVATRFGVGSAERKVEIEELVSLVEWAERAGILRVLVDGSFVSSKRDPVDVDVVVLPGPDYPRGESPLTEWDRPFLQVFTAVDDSDLVSWAVQIFGTDREGYAKGRLLGKLHHTGHTIGRNSLSALRLGGMPTSSWACAKSRGNPPRRTSPRRRGHAALRRPLCQWYVTEKPRMMLGFSTPYGWLGFRFENPRVTAFPS